MNSKTPKRGDRSKAKAPPKQAPLSKLAIEVNSVSEQLKPISEDLIDDLYEAKNSDNPNTVDQELTGQPNTLAAIGESILSHDPTESDQSDETYEPSSTIKSVDGSINIQLDPRKSFTSCEVFKLIEEIMNSLPDKPYQIKQVIQKNTMIISNRSSADTKKEECQVGGPNIQPMDIDQTPSDEYPTQNTLSHHISRLEAGVNLIPRKFGYKALTLSTKFPGLSRRQIELIYKESLPERSFKKFVIKTLKNQGLYQGKILGYNIPDN